MKTQLNFSKPNRYDYNSITRDIYLQNKENAMQNKNRNSTTDPIIQGNIKVARRPKVDNSKINYFKNTQEKKERNHIVSIPHEDHLIHDVQLINETQNKLPRKKLLEKVIINHAKDLYPKKRQIINKYHGLSNVGDLFHNYELYSKNNTNYNWKKNRRNLYNPKERKDLLDENPKNIKVYSSQKSLFDLDNEKKRLFPDTKIEKKKKKDNNSTKNHNTLKNYQTEYLKAFSNRIYKDGDFKLKIYHPKDNEFKANKDNIFGLFNSEINAKVPEQNLTKKVTNDNYSKFSNCAQQSLREHCNLLNKFNTESYLNGLT